MAKARKVYDEDEDEEKGDVERAAGRCKDCQFFDIDHNDEDLTDESLAPCIHPDLEEYDLTVSGDSGCNLFEPWDGEDEDDEEDDEEEEEEEVY